MTREMSDEKRASRKYPTIAVCGLDCGFCPRYYTRGPSRCPGCGGPGFSDKHPSCAFITCCVKKKGLEVCAECQEYPCPRFKTDQEYQRLEESASYPSCKVMLRNLRAIKEEGLTRFVARQKRRLVLLERMINDFDDGRSRSFFCRTVCVRDAKSLQRALDEAVRRIRMDRIEPDDRKSRARILREALTHHVTEAPDFGTKQRG